MDDAPKATQEEVQAAKPAPMTKRERLSIYFDRLRAAPVVSTAAAARALIDDTLDAVEDEFSGIAKDPSGFAKDGRMYPTSDEFRKAVPGRPDLTLYLSTKQDILIRANGAFLIRTKATDVPLVTKLGADGRPLEE